MVCLYPGLALWGACSPCDQDCGTLRSSHHVELARVRHLLHRLTGTPPVPAPDRCRSSIHRDRTLSWAAWVEDVARMLEACGQVEMAKCTMATASEPEPQQSLSPLHATTEPRRVGKQLWSLKHYHHYHRLRSRLAQLYHRRASALTNPFPEMLVGRGIRTMMLIGVSSEGGVGELARNACRRSPEPCTLIAVGDLPGPNIPIGRALGREATPSATVGRYRSFYLTEAPSSLVRPRQVWCLLTVCLSAKLVVLTNADEKALPTLAAELDATPSWKRATSSRHRL